MEEEEVLASINHTSPDIIWVGLSTPSRNTLWPGIPIVCYASLMVGVGAAFDIHAGLLADAPSWIKPMGLQWLDRLIKEPRRLWRRYLTNNPKFLWDIGMQLSGLSEIRHQRMLTH